VKSSHELFLMVQYELISVVLCWVKSILPSEAYVRCVLHLQNYCVATRQPFTEKKKGRPFGKGSKVPFNLTCIMLWYLSMHLFKFKGELSVTQKVVFCNNRKGTHTAKEERMRNEDDNYLPSSENNQVDLNESFKKSSQVHLFCVQ
jgi:hypothetical protein